MQEQCGSLVDLFLTLYCPDSFRGFLLSASTEKDLKHWKETMIDYISGWDQIVKIHISPIIDILCVYLTDLRGFSQR